MTLAELTKVKESLEECRPNVEDFSWGPTLLFAEQRKEEALKIIKKEIKHVRNK